MANTPFLGLSTFDTASGSATTFLQYRLAMAGNSSNMTSLDNYLSSVSGSVLALGSNRVVTVNASQISPNYYEATVPAITSYATNLIINLKTNSSISGSATININSYGIKSLKKINSGGSLVDLISGDIVGNDYRMFVYNGTDFIAIGPLTSASSAGGTTYTGSNVITVTGSVISHNTSGVTSGSYNVVLVDSRGHVTAGSVVAGGSAYTGSNVINVSGSVISHNTSGVVSGSYNKVIVDSRGHVTAGSIIDTSNISGSSVMSNTSGSVVKHNSSGVLAGNYLAANITVDSFGHVTSASNGVSASSVGAPSDSPFITSASSSSLADYRILSAGNNITITSASVNGGNITITASAPGWFNVKNYGAIGDGSNDDTSAINSAISAIPPRGGVLYFPAGTYLTSGSFNLPKNTRVLGDGNSSAFSGSTSATTIQCNSLTNSLFLVNYFGCSFDGFLAINTTASPTAGAAITIVDGGDWVTFNNLTLRNFYINLDVRDGSFWSADHCNFVNPVLYGMKIQHSGFADGGDQMISNCVFWPWDQDSTSAIRIESGGGVKITNTKIVGCGQNSKWFDYGIDLRAGQNVETILLQVTNTSIEDCVINGIYATTSASKPSNWDKIIIDNVEIAFWNVAGQEAILIEPDAVGEIDEVILNNLIFQGATNSGPAIQLTNVQKARIGLFTITGFVGDIATTNCSDVSQFNGKITGPSSAVDGNLVVFDGTSGKLVKDTGISITGSLISGGGYTQGARVMKSSSQSVSTGGGVAILFDVEDWDTDGIHSTSVDTSRLTCQTAGKYIINANIVFESNSSGYRNAYLQVHSGATDYYPASDVRNAVNGADTGISLTGTWDMGVGDYVEVWASQNSGGNLNITNGVTCFTMQRIG